MKVIKIMKIMSDDASNQPPQEKDQGSFITRESSIAGLVITGSPPVRPPPPPGPPPPKGAEKEKDESNIIILRSWRS